MEELGPFFELATRPADAAATGRWRPMSELVDDPERLRARIEKVAAALAARSGQSATSIDRRVAGSVTQLGLTARIVAPHLAAYALDLPRHDLRLGSLWWQDTLGGPYPLIAPAVSHIAMSILDDPIEPLTLAVHHLARTPLRVLWGNIASAINSAAMAIIATQPPTVERGTLEAVRNLFADPRLAQETSPPGHHFRRHSCCLIYRVAGTRAAICGDCILQTD